MNISEITKFYTQNRTVAEGFRLLEKPRARISVEGTVGSGLAFVAQGLARKGSSDHLFVFGDREEAAYFFNDLQALMGDRHPVLFYPQSYRVPYRSDAVTDDYTAEETDNANVVLRAEVLKTLSSEREVPALVVTYPGALAEKVVTRKQLDTNTFHIRTGDKHSIEFLNEVLMEYGFKREDFVYEPGQFSIRGGIMDVFSYGEDHPFRIEFFGDEIESMRRFDPVSQLSTDKAKKFTVIPNIQDDSLSESMESFLEFIGSKTTIWFDNREVIASTLDRVYQSAEEAYTELKTAVKFLPPEEKYHDGKRFLSEMEAFTLVNFGTVAEPGFEKIVFHQAPAPTFNKNFELLRENLLSNTAEGLENFIFSSNPQQLDRLDRIFADIGGEVRYTPVDSRIAEGFVDRDLNIACYTDHEIFERYHRFYLKEGFKKNREALTLRELNSLQPGDYVTHIDHGVGKFSGLEKINVNGKEQEAIRLLYRDNDLLYVSIHSLHRISKYSGKEGTEPTVNKLGSGAWQKAKARTKKRVKEIAYDLIKLYAKRKAQKGFAFSPDTYLQTELEASFVFEDTPDQSAATQAVKEDMESESPMDRLICGDVGFGKTEVAIRAAFKAVTDGKQVAVLVPTTILSMQHYRTFKERLEQFPVNVKLLNRFVTGKKHTETLKALAEGKIDIIIGTHKLVGKQVKFADLGLLVIDEEQKFGVGVKDKLKTLRATVDTLTLTATPIPRTLQFSMMGARDMSIIRTPPPNRYPVRTELHTFREDVIRDAIAYEINRGGQVFFIHNKIENIHEVAGMIKRLVPDARVGVGHGRLKGPELEKVMTDFIEGDFDVLVATTIVESGIDIPNANTILINDAHNFGLSDLHQLRGRVGRSNKKAFCHLIAPPLSLVSEESQKRLRAITQFSDLGSGLNIAMRDLDIRGAGDLLGAEQSGFINELGFETYQKILHEAVRELKEEEFKELYDDSHQTPGSYVDDCVLETDLELLIPDDYISEITERLNVYRHLDNLSEESELLSYREELRDRFGELPEETEALFDAIRLRRLAKEIGLEKLVLKGGKLIGYFISNSESPYFGSPAFTEVLNFIKTNPKGYKMYEKNGSLRISKSDVNSVTDAIEGLSAMAPEHKEAVEKH